MHVEVESEVRDKHYFKVLVLTENFPPKSGGSGRWFWELYSRLPADNFIVVTDDEVDDCSADNEIENTIIRMKLRSFEWGLRSLKGLKFYWHTVFALRRIIKEHRITHVHCGRVIHEGVIAWLLSMMTPIKYVCYVHGEDVETAAMSKEHDLMVRQVCKNAERIICNSHNSSTIVQKLKYAEQDKIDVLHPGVDCARFIPVEPDDIFRENMAWTNKFVILTVGRLQKRKGHDRMIEAVDIIRKSYPDVLYVIIGNGDEKEALSLLVENLELSDNVIFLDEISDQQMIQCYQQCDLFILPNRTIDNDIEGFGMVLVEAQSCGKPVIAGDSGGTRETMIIDKTGWIIDCTEASLIAQKVSEICSNREYLLEVGKAGRQHVESELDWLAHTRKASDIFDGLIQ